jgi:peptidoglycan/LPS O-acetylase OafA/YrhL
LNYGHLFAAGWSRAGYQTFLGRRIARIYPLYFVAIITGFVFVTAGWLGYDRNLPLSVALIVNLLMVQAWGLAPSFDSPAWSISTEWAAYLLFPALLIPAMFRGAQTAWLLGLLCAAALTALCSLPPALLPDYLVHDPLNMSGYWLGLPVLRCVTEFTLGILAFRAASTPFGRRVAAHLWIAPVLGLSAVALLALPKCDLAVVLLMPFIVVTLASETHMAGRILACAPVEFLGKLSFSLYLSHKLLFGLLNALYWRAHFAGLPHARSLAAAVCIALSFALALAAYHFIEVPGRRYLRDVFARGSRGAARVASPAPNQA